MCLCFPWCFPWPESSRLVGCFGLIQCMFIIRTRSVDRSSLPPPPHAQCPSSRALRAALPVNYLRLRLSTASNLDLYNVALQQVKGTNHCNMRWTATTTASPRSAKWSIAAAMVKSAGGFLIVANSVRASTPSRAFSTVTTTTTAARR